MTLDARTASCLEGIFFLVDAHSADFSARDVRPVNLFFDRVRSAMLQSNALPQAAEVHLEPWRLGNDTVWLSVQTAGGYFLVIEQNMPPLAWQDERSVASHFMLPEGENDQAGKECVLIGPFAARPVSWSDVADELAVGQAVAERIGSSLAALHARCVELETLPDQAEQFRSARLRPDFQMTARSHRDLAAFIEAVVKEITGLRLGLLLGRPAAELVLLAGENPVWLGLDTVHVGDPAVDVSTLLADLLVRACTAPNGPEGYVEAAQALWQGYVTEAGPDFAHSGMLQGSLEARVCRQVGVLILAAVDGQHRGVGNLTRGHEHVLRSVGRSLLMRPFGRLDGVFTRVWQVNRLIGADPSDNFREQVGGER